MLSSLEAGPFSVSQIVLVTGSRVKPKEFLIQYAKYLLNGSLCSIENGLSNGGAPWEALF
ncbi:MAG: hypothetical protein R2685_00040 [Candidatus Nitrosocosmicus sp.]|nr:hypothetical protein [Candidatus Nitrosocosmicus sp. SS]MDR4489283.1 hypothetical protein [Candidatus Nitrosocosmicus sp.]